MLTNITEALLECAVLVFKQAIALEDATEIQDC
jgi:hypothetical protein